MVGWDIRTNDMIKKHMLYTYPLMYVENGIELAILSPNSLIYSHSIRVSENVFDDDSNFLKRQRYIKQCKQAAWNGWKNGYLRILRMRHDTKHKPSKKELKRTLP